MRELSRRSLLRISASLGVTGALTKGALASESDSSESEHHRSPDLDKYVQPLPIPEERDADGWYRGADYHEIPIEETSHSFHPDLGETTIWGFDGQFPGPILSAYRGERLAVEFDNSGLPEDHLFEIDERIPGTTSDNYVDYDGPVPDVRNVTHIHGLNVNPEADGQAEMWTSPDGVTGPRFADAVQEFPNRQPRYTGMYHDHARGISRLNNYAGLVGPYIIKSRREEFMDLPDGEYDVPLVLADRTFHDDGELFYPDEFMATFAGDTSTVNGAVWPYMEVEPRKYRFRIINLSNSRAYDLGLRNENGDDHDVPTKYQISASHGFLDEVVPISHGEDMESLVVAPFERAEIVVDFSEYAGETLTVTNGADFPYAGGSHSESGDHSSGSDSGGMDMGDGGMDMGHDGIKPQFDEVMQFQVTEEVSEPDWNDHPTDLWLPDSLTTDPEEAETTRTITMGMGMDEHGLMRHHLNDRHWGDGVHQQPQLGSTEIWELVNDTDHTHPIHLHLVHFDVIEREQHDSDHGPQPPLPNERGGKDTVRVDPGETVRIAVEFGDYTGKFPFHCHILEHEEHDMMRQFEVVGGEDDDERGWGDDDTDHDQGWGNDGEDGNSGRGNGRGRDDDDDDRGRGDDGNGRGW